MKAITRPTAQHAKHDSFKNSADCEAKTQEHLTRLDIYLALLEGIQDQFEDLKRTIAQQHPGEISRLEPLFRSIIDTTEQFRLEIANLSGAIKVKL